MVGYKGETGVFDNALIYDQATELRDEVLNRIKSLFPQKVIALHVQRGHRAILVLDNGLRIVLQICRRAPPVRKARWCLLRGQPRSAQLDLICLLNENNGGVYRFFLVPHFDSGPLRRKLREHADRLLSTGINLDDLSQLYEAAICLASNSAERIRYLYRSQEGAV